MAEEQITAFAALQYGAPLEKWTFTPEPLKANQIQARILACGVCASDVDLLNAKYGPELTAALGFGVPLVAGHEGVGVVEKVGDLVKHLKVGDRVGLGVHRSSCGNCNPCANGDTNLCAESLLMFAKGNKGCFADAVRINSDFAFKIPDAIETSKAGPLMCAGLTTFAPFKVHNIRPGQKVGVLGIGGLGHLALQFAKGFGCDVYALSRGRDKEAEALSLGARHFVDTTSTEPNEGLASIASKLDFLFVTAGGSSTDFGALLRTLAKGGKMVMMGFVAPSVTVPLADLVSGQRSVCGSAAGSRAVMKEMLDFAALHNVRPVTEEFPFDKINDAIAHVKSGKARYRVVLISPSQ